MNYLAAVFVTTLPLAALLLRLVFIRWRDGGPCELRLPPGSRGLPLVGETLEFFAASPTLELPPFFKRRLERYGPIFRTSVVGEDLIVSLDPVLNSLVLQQEERAFQIWYPSSFMRVLGADSVITALGPLHRHIRALMLRLFGPESLRLVLLRDVHRSARDELRSWLGRPDVEVRTATSRMIFGVTAKKLISHDDAASQSQGRLWKCFDACTRGLLAFPLCVPGTAFYGCVQGRKRVMKMLSQQLGERRGAAAEREAVDFFDVVIEELDKPGSEMTENMALDLLFLMLFASHETTSIGLTAVLKFLTDNPKALQELTEEHKNIQKRRADPVSDEITWEEYKSMRFTSHVIHEALRLANIAPVVFRKAKQDVQINDYTIPQGSKIMICTSAAHMNAEVYEEPSMFNPWRWRDTPETVGGSKDFMAFGGGVRLCVGADFAKLQMAIFLHCLVTKYRWETISGGTMVFYPGLRFPDGFHIHLRQKD